MEVVQFVLGFRCGASSGNYSKGPNFELGLGVLATEAQEKSGIPCRNPYIQDAITDAIT
jgi:hypothetical protein